MPFNEKLSMKDLLSEGLYILMQQKPFEKITIKQICDKTGVIRGTFYNHFMDKYEALEYLIHTMFYQNQQVYDRKFFKHIFDVIEQNQDFFIACFKITGQNGFEDLMNKEFKTIFTNIFENLDLSKMDSRFTRDFLIDYYAHELLYFIEYWIKHNFMPDVESYYIKIVFLFRNSLKDLNIKYVELEN